MRDAIRAAIAAGRVARVIVTAISERVPVPGLDDKTQAFTDPFVPAMGAGAKSVLFGDWSHYFVRMVNGIRFERSNDYAFNSDLVTFRAILRADAALVDTTGAIKWFAHSAA
ncbi:phage major capsid protein [Streptomyces sp. 4503]|uniref:Phage major capsid protein n=1 Tax=Streptomyces niphimycinicus TaxID=2842201 RepID=A0ABS6CB23_9ACTN|nr:phage major capsid protein [Streptomyces niphimycinicus]MBU3864000.1 phage major capsid protein [Streptomyces niphimycinicus]